MVVPIHVHPLRDRKDDIPLLVRHFLDEFNRHFGYEKTLSPEYWTSSSNTPGPETAGS